VKSLKKFSMVRSLWLVVGLLAGAALAAAAESRIDLESGSHNSTLALTGATTAQISSGNCLGSNCPTNAVVTLSRADGWPISSGFRNLAPRGGGTLSVSNISRFNRSLIGPVTLQNGVDSTARIPSTFALNFADANLRPQFHLTTATMSGGIGSPYPQGSGGGLGSIVNQLFCSSPTRVGCISETLFNSNPTIKSAPTGRVTLAPEPTAAFLLGTGLLALGLIRRRSKKPGRTEV
jgi:hypothetical protein